MQQPRQGANPAQTVLEAALVGPDEPAGLVTRLLPPPPPSAPGHAPGPAQTSASGQNSSQHASSRLQTLVVTYDGDAYELEGAEGPGVQPVALGRHVDLWRVVPAGGRVPAVDDAMEYGWPVAGVPGDGAFYCLEETSIMRVDAEGLVTTVAGSRDVEGDTDGPGPAARFDHPACLTSDGAGALYLACRTRVRRVQLPMGGEGGGNVGAALGTPAAGPGPGAGAGAAAQAGLGPNPGPAAQTGGTSEAAMALVSTLPFTAPDEIAGLAFVHPSPITRPTAGPGPSSSSATSPGLSPPAGGGHLLLATRTAVYRANLGAGTGPAALTLLAGAERGDDGPVDGRGAEARFSNIWGLVVDGEGAAYAIDWDRVDVTTAVRRVLYDGTVTTVVSDLEGELERPAVLPNGCLVLCGYAQLVILALGLPPPPLCARPPPAREEPAAGPPRRTLHADMGALLDAQPDGTADLTLVVGDRCFAVHRAILIARCDYFRQRLGGGFADGAEAELSLPDADPAAFELLLRFIYTGAAPIPPALAPAVAELADRLLLPELCSDAQAAVLSGVTAETVVGSLLWAERLGGSFADLFSSLKAWYLEHHEEVLESAEDSVRRLAESPDLVLELMRALALHSKQQQQQQQQQRAA